MLEFLRKNFNKIGVDGAIAFTIGARLLQAVGGVVTLLFIVSFLTDIEQGYYYTFGSILAIQVFFELGLTGILVQYVAHETGSLKWYSMIRFEGSPESTSRIASLLRFSVKWFGILSIILFLFLIILGFAFFNFFGKSDDLVRWEGPWLLLSLATSMSLILSPILAVLEGLGKIREIAKLRLVQQVVQLSAIYLFFNIGLKLYAAPLSLICAFLTSVIWLYSTNLKELLFFAWNKLGDFKVNYFKEIFPFQWKISLSWISGYFLFQLFNPILFATEGPIVAGQMGMTIAVLNSILALSMSWTTTKVPVYSQLIASKRYPELDILFNRTLIQSSIINLCGLLFFLLIVFLIRHYHIELFGKYFGDRFLSLFPLICMMLPILLNHIIGGLATYLRCHKQEPMLVSSIVIGALCAISTIFMGKNFGVNGIALGYCLVTIMAFVWTIHIFLTKRNEWHNL